MVRAEMTSDCRGMRRFVVLRFLEADRERLDWPHALRLHQGNDGRTVNAPGKKRAQRNIGDHLFAYGIAQ